MSYPSRSELINYSIRIRDQRVREFIQVKRLLKKYPHIWSRIDFYYKRLELYSTSDINVYRINRLVNTQKSIDFINQKLDTIYSEEFKTIINIIRIYK